MNRPQSDLAQIVEGLRSQVEQLGHPLKMLLVDDELSDLILTRNAIHAARPDTICEMAMSAQEALSMLRAGNYDMVLLDLRMPGSDGVTLIDDIHARKFPVQILCMSGLDNGPLVIEAIKRGALVHIRKGHLQSDIQKLFAWKQPK